MSELRTDTIGEDPWEDLVLSILSVNQYSLERTYRSTDGLRKAELFDPRQLMLWDQSEIVERLRSAGCNRGPFMTALFAFRLYNLGVLIKHHGVELCTKIISGHDMRTIEELLLPVNGIGPKVIANFRLLRGSAVK